ncbi:YolD-like family protein [Bacillus sp. EB106-08-02-XG196]|uniref:YolD-like family protein n=1 Tax=Bacillus sp. EB106-08-02-XG196 TaxID=2737049 RepID=UPI0015C4635D|nr:YolD-like family protein [Bacillus sp. EB106-08-02-XG196]NWQ40364.1 YolD-like family protein [Bacillus sp. EB106-08-02-XG196]
MAIRDRGKKKWAPASFMPEGFAMTREMFKDKARQEKPILDEYQTEEFDLRIAYAMEYKHAVKLTLWSDGFTSEVSGGVHYVDPITKQLRIETKPGEFERVAFEDVIGVKVK